MNNTGKLANAPTISYAEHLRDTIARMTASPEKADFSLLAAMADRLAESVLAGPLAVALPCEFGADIWWIDDDGPAVACEKGAVAGFIVYDDEIKILDRDGGISTIGEPDCFLTKEEAESYLYCATTPGEA